MRKIFTLICIVPLLLTACSSGKDKTPTAVDTVVVETVELDVQETQETIVEEILETKETELVQETTYEEPAWYHYQSNYTYKFVYNGNIFKFPLKVSDIDYEYRVVEGHSLDDLLEPGDTNYLKINCGGDVIVIGVLNKTDQYCKVRDCNLISIAVDLYDNPYSVPSFKGPDRTELGSPYSLFTGDNLPAAVYDTVDGGDGCVYVIERTDRDGDIGTLHYVYTDNICKKILVEYFGE